VDGVDQQPVSSFGVLGPVAAWDGAGARIDLKGPRHREVLARLIAARGRVVPVATLIEDLWIEPPAGAVGAVRTFVGALRQALEPHRPPRTPPTLLVTEGPGYALRAEEVDAWRFERALEAAGAVPQGAAGPEQALTALREALDLWRGPAYADFADAAWARAERARLGELRLHAVERVAELRLALGRPAEAVADLDAHAAEHPWREHAWGLLALALHRSGRQGDALAVLRQARTRLAHDLGLDPGKPLRRAEREISGNAVDELWSRATADYDRTVAAGTRARLESTVGLLRDLAVTGGLEASRAHRAAAVAAAEQLGDPELTARVIGAYDVPALWSRVDDPPQAAQIVAAAERTLTALGEHAQDAARARLLATIALESRGTRSRRAPEAAREAERLARGLDDPQLLAFALNAVFMQSFGRAGLAGTRDAIGAELIDLAARHGLPTFEVLGHLIRLQARCALDDLPQADAHADAADSLAARHELPLVAVFTELYAALKAGTEQAYEAARPRLDAAGMPGLRDGLLALARLCVRVRDGRPSSDDDFGPSEPWARPLLSGRTHRVPDPPHDHLLEVRWCLAAKAAREHGDEALRARAEQALTPAASELAAGSGVIALGPVAKFLSASSGS
jgi:DNA-binding SARP family transcriptional activator